jgi:uncharacterized membrane protein
LPIGVFKRWHKTSDPLLCGKQSAIGNWKLTMPMYASPDNYIPQSVSVRRPLVMWLVVATGSVAVVALILGAPLALSAGHGLVAQTIYQTFSFLCHQIPERSFFIKGHQFGVCARCTGLYSGFMFATLVYPLIRSLRQTKTPPRKWLFIAAAPLAIDFALEFFRIMHNTHLSRFSTGALLGAVAVFYILPGLLDLSLRDWRRARNLSSKPEVKTEPAKVFSTTVSSAPSDYSAPHRRI